MAPFDIVSRKAFSMTLKGYIRKRFSLAAARGIDIDSTDAVNAHRVIIKENPLLSDHYAFIYRYFKSVEDSLPDSGYPSLEIGSGGGFLKEYLPRVITSDIVKSGGIDRVEDATKLSFSDASLKAIYANGVMHHIKDPAAFLGEAQRVLTRGGKLVCNEPSSTAFGYFMNRFFHDEKTDKRAPAWMAADTAPKGRLSGANMALPYIIFKRDRKLFRRHFGNLRIISFRYHDFLRYTLSGGLSYRPFVPPYLNGAVNLLESLARPMMPVLGHAMLVTVQKIYSASPSSGQTVVWLRRNDSSEAQS